MVWAQHVEYVEAEIVLPPPVKKQVWDGEQFVPLTLYKTKGCPSKDQEAWLNQTAGYGGSYANGTYWDYSRTGDFTIMDEKLYVWYQMKWKNK